MSNLNGHQCNRRKAVAAKKFQFLQLSISQEAASLHVRNEIIRALINRNPVSKSVHAARHPQELMPADNAANISSTTGEQLSRLLILLTKTSSLALTLRIICVMPWIVNIMCTHSTLSAIVSLTEKKQFSYNLCGSVRFLISEELAMDAPPY